MKKLWIAFAIAMAALMIIASPALAYYDPDDASAEVTCDEPGVDNENPTVGETVLFYGTVHVNASSYNDKNYHDGYSHSFHSWYITGAYSEVYGDASYVIYAPDGVTIVASGGNSWDDSDWGDTGCCWDENTSASISEDWDWEAPVFLDTAGDYTVVNDGYASAEYGMWLQLGHYEGYGKYRHFVPDGSPFLWTEDFDELSCSAQRTVTARSAVVATASQSHPYLVLNLPDGSRHFYSNDGWGDPTTQGIAYTDGTWQVEISNGTAIKMDGSWHRTTYLDVDDQGNVTGRYDAGGSTVAEEIGLSQPITITKVG